jgi:hypothetical protein
VTRIFKRIAFRTETNRLAGYFGGVGTLSLKGVVKILRKRLALENIKTIGKGAMIR